MKESEIRPKDIFEEYLRLSKLDIKKFFSNDKEREEINCPACDTKNNENQFIKDQFNIKLCSSCESLYVSPRPLKDNLEIFYQNSVSSNYWAEIFFPKVAEKRRDTIFKERVKEITNFCDKNNLSHQNIIDVGAGYGIFLEEWKKVHLNDNTFALEPGEKLAQVCRSKDIITLEKFSEDAEEWVGKADLVMCFEVFEHVHSPYDFVNSLKKLLKPNGTLLISSLTVDGFDIQSLWDISKSISPPHHLNFLSIKGIKKLFNRLDLKVLDISTPGKLDIDIVKNYLYDSEKKNENFRFIKKVISRGSNAEEDLQKFLQKHKLSSHFWIFGRK